MRSGGQNGGSGSDGLGSYNYGGGGQGTANLYAPSSWFSYGAGGTGGNGSAGGYAGGTGGAGSNGAGGGGGGASAGSCWNYYQPDSAGGGGGLVVIVANSVTGTGQVSALGGAAAASAGDGVIWTAFIHYSGNLTPSVAGGSASNPGTAGTAVLNQINGDGSLTVHANWTDTW